MDIKSAYNATIPKHFCDNFGRARDAWVDYNSSSSTRNCQFGKKDDVRKRREQVQTHEMHPPTPRERLENRRVEVTLISVIVKVTKCAFPMQTTTGWCSRYEGSNWQKETSWDLRRYLQSCGDQMHVLKIMEEMTMETDLPHNSEERVEHTTTRERLLPRSTSRDVPWRTTRKRMVAKYVAYSFSCADVRHGVDRLWIREDYNGSPPRSTTKRLWTRSSCQTNAVWWKKGPQELTLRAGERQGQEAFVDTREQVEPPLPDSDWSALCQTLYDGVEQEDLESTYNVLQEAAKVDVNNIGESTSLLWKLNEKKGDGEGETIFDEHLRSQVKNRTQERKDLWEVCPASLGRTARCQIRKSVRRTCDKKLQLIVASGQMWSET